MRPRRQPPGYDLSRGLPFRQETNDVALCVRGERVARDDYELVDQRVGDLVYDAGQGGKAQREHDGISALQRVAVVDGDDGSSTDLGSQRSCRLVGAREPQGLAAGGELAGDDRSEPSSADDRGGHDGNLLSVPVLTTAARGIAGDLGIHSYASTGALDGH